MRTLALAATGEESREAPRNSHGDWTFLRPDVWVPEVPIITQEESQVRLPQLKKNPELFPSTQDQVLFHSDVSREIPPSLLSLESILDTLRQHKKFPDTPVSTLEEHRGSRHKSRRPRFSLLIPRRGFTSLLRRERNPSVPITTQEETVST